MKQHYLVKRAASSWVALRRRARKDGSASRSVGRFVLDGIFPVRCPPLFAALVVTSFVSTTLLIAGSASAQDEEEDDIEIEVEDTPGAEGEPPVGDPPAGEPAPPAEGAAPQPPAEGAAPSPDTQPPDGVAPSEEAPAVPAPGEAPPAEEPAPPVEGPSLSEEATSDPPTEAAEAPVEESPSAPGASVSAEATEPVEDPSEAEPSELDPDEGRAGLAVPEARAPAAETHLPRSLVAEGSNYTRPLRLGLSWWGFVQADYVRDQISENQLDPDGRSLNRDQFGLRRGRLRFDHGWEYAFVTLEIDAGTFGEPNVQIRRGEASLLYRAGRPDSVAPPLVLTGGITDVPFGAEVGESQRDRVFVERSLGSVAIFPALADGGLKLWGAYGALNYAVALLNGESELDGRIPIDQDSHKDVAGRVGVFDEIGESVTFSSGLSFYVGTGFSPGTLATKDSVQWIDLNNNGVTDSGEIQGVTGTAALPSRSYSRFAVGLDAGATFNHGLGVFTLGAEVFYASNLDRGVLPQDPNISGTDSRQLGVMGSVVQQITQWGALGFRAAYYDPNSNLVEQRSGNFHLKDQSFLVLSPVAAFTLAHGRITAQYDFIKDNLGRDLQGVPANIRNDQLTLRLQVDL